MLDSTANLYSFMPPTINQSERDYSIRHGEYVRCFNQSEHSYGVRHGVNVHSFSQSERGYGVRHGVYVRCFNQSEHGYSVRHGVYVTGCTYAFRPISAKHSRILISAAPCGGLRYPAQPRAVSRNFTQPRCVRHEVYVRCLTNQDTIF